MEPLFIGLGRIIDIALILAAVFFVLSGTFFWLPIVCSAIVAIEVGWELFLKRVNTDWYWEAGTFDFVTDRIAVLGMPLSFVRIAIVFMVAWILIKN